MGDPPVITLGTHPPFLYYRDEGKKGPPVPMKDEKGKPVPVVDRVVVCIQSFQNNWLDIKKGKAKAWVLIADNKGRLMDRSPQYTIEYKNGSFFLEPYYTPEWRVATDIRWPMKCEHCDRLVRKVEAVLDLKSNRYICPKCDSRLGPAPEPSFHFPPQLVEGQKIALFIWPAFTLLNPGSVNYEGHKLIEWLYGGKVKIDYLQEKKLVQTITLTSDSFKKGKGILLPCPIDIYIERLWRHTGKVDSELRIFQNIVNKAMTCAAILDQAHNLIIERGFDSGKHLAEHTINPALNLANCIQDAYRINGTVIEDLKKVIVRHTKKYQDNFRKRVRRHLKIIWDILNSKAHAEQFSKTDWDIELSGRLDLRVLRKSSYRLIRGTGMGKIIKETAARLRAQERKAVKGVLRAIIDIYVEAYVLMFKADPDFARQTNPKGPYKAHLENLFNECAKAKNKQQAKSAVKKVKSKAPWLELMDDGIIKLIAATKTMEDTNDFEKSIQQHLTVAGFLWGVGIAQGIEGFRSKLGEAKELYKQKKLGKSLDSLVKTDEAIDGIVIEDVTVGATLTAYFKVAVQVLTLNNALKKEDKTIRDHLDVAWTSYSTITEILDIPQVKNALAKYPKAVKIIGRVRGVVVTEVVDWGFSIYDMYEAADTGDAKKFAYSVISYAGKGLVAGGAIVSLCGLLPLGAVLAAVGTAITIIGQIVEAIASLKVAYTVEEEKYIHLMKKVFKNDPWRDLLECRYKHRMEKQIKTIDDFFRSYMLIVPRDKELIIEKFGDLKLRDYVHRFFESNRETTTEPTGPRRGRGGGWEISGFMVDMYTGRGRNWGITYEKYKTPSK